MPYIEKNELLNGIYSENPEDVMLYIARFPTADVVERKKGKWIEETGMLMCSECGDAWGTQQFDEVMSFNYCPNCCAKMREETEDVH